MSRVPLDLRAMIPASLALGLAVLLGACTSVRALGPGEPPRLEPGEAFAFGRVRVFEDGRELTPWNVDLLEELVGMGEPEIRFALFRVESEERALYPEIRADGWFEWVLPAGTWLLYRSTQGVPVSHDVLCAFQVRAGGEAQYLGELDLDVAVERDPALPEATAWSVEGVSVRSDPGAARAHLGESHPEDALDLVERPMRCSPELRELFDDWTHARGKRELIELGFELLPE